MMTAAGLSRRIARVSEPLIDTFNRKARALAASGADLISLGQALPGFQPPAVALAAARKALEVPATHVYSPDAGDPELQKLVAAWIARHDGIRINPDTQLIVTAGGNQALMLALQCCVDGAEVVARSSTGQSEAAREPDEVLVPSPYFMNHEMAVRVVDAVPIEVATSDRNGYVITARQLFGEPAPFAKAVIITTPNNPTGAIVPRREIDRIARACAERGMFLILDRTYAGFEFEREPERTRLKAIPDNVVIVGSFSKVFAMTGWRVGYLAGASELIREALKAQDTMIICAPTISQIAVRAALKARRGVPAAYMRDLRRRRDYVQTRVAELRGWSAVPAAGGFFTFARIEGCTDSVQFADVLLERAHVLVMPGKIFGEAGEGHIRISYGVADLPILERAFDRIRLVTN
jgi:aspartate/methionine/tyrosine aminotransferase